MLSRKDYNFGYSGVGKLLKRVMIRCVYVKISNNEKSPKVKAGRRMFTQMEESRNLKLLEIIESP